MHSTDPITLNKYKAGVKLCQSENTESVTNRVDPDQKLRYDLCLHGLLWPVHPNCYGDKKVKPKLSYQHATEISFSFHLVYNV